MHLNYPYIKAYGKHVGFSDAKIAEQVEQAQRDDAPTDVVRFAAGRWTRFEHYDAHWQQILNPDFKNQS